MEPNQKKSNPSRRGVEPRSDEKTGFTIVELLTVMSIIIILIGLLLPALSRVRRYAVRVKQKAQFHSIAIALDLFHAEYEGYPPSEALDPNGKSYCGAMKLAEAMVGHDLKGFNLDSRFYAPLLTPLNPGLGILYPRNPGTGDATYPAYVDNIKSRRMYLELENANAYRLTDVFDAEHLDGTAFVPATNYDPGNLIVLCDSYVRTMRTGNKTGMPILYYKADNNKNEHDPNQITTNGCNNTNIYNYCDNQDLVNIPLPWLARVSLVEPRHPMAIAIGRTLLGVTPDPAIFYTKTRNEKITTDPRPYRADSYILISAGFDGEYGTSDDVFNFGE